MELNSQLSLTAKKEELLLKPLISVNQISGPTGNIEQSLCAYKRWNNVVTENSQTSFTAAGVRLIHMGLLAGRALKSQKDSYVQFLSMLLFHLLFELQLQLSNMKTKIN